MNPYQIEIAGCDHLDRSQLRASASQGQPVKGSWQRYAPSPMDLTLTYFWCQILSRSEAPKTRREIERMLAIARSNRAERQALRDATEHRIRQRKLQLETLEEQLAAADSGLESLDRCIDHLLLWADGVTSSNDSVPLQSPNLQAINRDSPHDSDRSSTSDGVDSDRVR